MREASGKALSGAKITFDSEILSASEVTVTVSGVGTLIGLGSADSNAYLHGTEPEKGVDHNSSSQGMLKAFVQSADAAGTVAISASAQGLCGVPKYSGA